MILHLATFRWKDEVSAEEVAKLCDELVAFRRRVDGIVDYHFGSDLRLRPGNADFGIVALVESPETLQGYLDHPAHHELYQKFIGPMIASRTAVQIMVEGAPAVPYRQEA
jgi:stress responsive alpha/beta barrel protein